MWLEGTTVDEAIGRDSITHTRTRYSCSLALPERGISFFDIIICVITYEAIKQTSVPISSPSISALFLFCIFSSPAICAPITAPPFYVSSSLPLLIFLPSCVTPDKVSISAC